MGLVDEDKENIPEEAVYQPHGSPIEAGLIKFLMKNDYHLDGKGMVRTMKYRNDD